MSEKLVRDILDAVVSLPPFSKVADRALLAERERSLSGASFNELGFHDPKLAQQILQMTNFTSFGFSENRAGFFESETIIASDVLRGVMLAYSIQEFINRELPAYDLCEQELWEHSMNCGLSAWMIATKVGYADSEAAFVAGMMHDIGKIVLNDFLYEEKQEYVDSIIRGGLTPVQAEAAILGIDHAEVGARIGEHWNFDTRVINAIKFHHQPELGEIDPDLTTILHLADCVSVSLNLALSGDSLIGLLAGDFSGSEARDAG